MAASGRMVLNCYGTSSYPYKNFIKNGNSLNGGATEAWGGYLDANGYPCQTPAGNIGIQVGVPRNYTGNYVIKFYGVGEIQIIATSTTVSDPDSCIVFAGSNTRIRSNAASEARGYTRVVINFTSDTGTFSVNFPSGSIKYSNVGGAAPNQISSMQNLVMCRCDAPYGSGGVTPAGDELDIDSGDMSRMFNDDSLAIHAALNPRALRFMGWQNINFSMTSQHSTRPPVAALQFESERFDPTIWAGVASGTNGNYSCAAAPSTPVSWTDGEQVQVQFTNAQQSSGSLTAVLTNSTLVTCTIADTSLLGLKVFVYVPGLTDSGNKAAQTGLLASYTPTVVNGTTFTITTTGAFGGSVTGAGNYQAVPQINVGSRGPKPIVNTYGIAAASFFNNTNRITANQQATLLFDSVLDACIVKAGGLLPSPPLEVMVALYNKLNKDLWLCFPITMTTAACVASAAYVRDNLNAGLNAYFEFGNENWNGGFTQNKICYARGYAYGFVTSSGQAMFSYWALRVAEIMSGIGAIWSGGVGLKRVIAFQGGGDTTTDTYLFTGSSLNSSSAAYWARNPVDWSVPGNQPRDHCEILSYADYYSGAQTLQFDANYAGTTAAAIVGLTGAADDYDSGDATRMAAALAWLDNDVRYGTTPFAALTSIAADGTITLNSHGFSVNYILQLSSSGALPSPLAVNTLYYPVSITTNTFKLSLTKGGAAITSLSGGSGTHSYGFPGQTSLYWSTDRQNFWNAYAASYNKGIVLYEGGQSSWYPLAATCVSLNIGGLGAGASVYSQRILNLIIAYKRNALSRRTNYDRKVAFMTGSKSVMPCELQTIGENPWSLLRGFADVPLVSDGSTFAGDINCATNAAWDACVLFNNRLRRVSLIANP